MGDALVLVNLFPFSHTDHCLHALPKRRRHYVPGPFSQVGRLDKGNSTSWEEPAGFPFDTGAVLLCANLNAKMRQFPRKNKKTKGGTNVVSCQFSTQTLYPKGEELGKFLLCSWVTAGLQGLNRRFIPTGVLKVWLHLEKRNF